MSRSIAYFPSDCVSIDEIHFDRSNGNNEHAQINKVYEKIKVILRGKSYRLISSQDVKVAKIKADMAP